jgi:hypothetical protein
MQSSIAAKGRTLQGGRTWPSGFAAAAAGTGVGVAARIDAAASVKVLRMASPREEEAFL